MAPAEPTDGKQALAAVHSASAALTDSYRRWPEVRRLVRRLDEDAHTARQGDNHSGSGQTEPEGGNHGNPP